MTNPKCRNCNTENLAHFMVKYQDHYICPNCLHILTLKKDPPLYTMGQMEQVVDLSALKSACENLTTLLDQNYELITPIKDKYLTQRLAAALKCIHGLAVKTLQKIKESPYKKE